MKGQNTAWVLGAFALGAVLAALMYVFLISPALAARAEAAEATAAARDQNEFLELRLLQYQADYEKLPEMREQVEEIYAQFSVREDVAQVRRDLEALLTPLGVSVVVDNVGDPILVTPGVISLAQPAASVGRVSYIEGLTFTDLYSSNFDMTISGPYEQVIKAIAMLQLHEGRYFLVHEVDIVPVGVAARDTPASALLDMEFFTMFDAATGVDPGSNSGSEDPDTGEPLPAPTPGDVLTPFVVTGGAAG
jgi:hypothetical protein